MWKRMIPGLLSLCLLLTGCNALLERSYSVVEPYADRYWDSAAEDTLRAENYQDLINSLLLLLEQRSEEGVIRYYGKENAYSVAVASVREVMEETVLGAYLLDSLTYAYKATESSQTLTYRMKYRAGTETLESLMAISDTQSLADLLRLAVREGHPSLAARFVTEVSRADVLSAVEALWLELCQGDTADGAAGDGDALSEAVPAEEQGEAADELTPSIPSDGVPPCPWTVRFYPDRDTAGIVEILVADK